MKQHRGFTLAEMAIVIVIVGILLTLGLGVATTQLTSAQRTTTQTSLANARDTLLAYFAGTHRFPCPDNTHTTGLETVAGTGCAAAIGTIPYQTIGLPKSQAEDAYGNMLTYVIDPQPDPAHAANWMWTNTLATQVFAGVTRCSDDGAHQDNGPRGEIRVMQSPTSEETTFNAGTPNARARAVFVLISHGADGLGAWSPNGTRHALPPGASPERPNTVANVNPTPPGNPNTYNDYVPSDAPAAPFDDLLTFVTEGNSPTAIGTLHAFMVSKLGRTDICT